jgi:hypothetical protein
MRDRDGGARGLQVSRAGHLPASAAAWKDGSRTPWQARRAPPEAVLIGKRRDPLLPLTGNNRKRSGCPATGNGTARPSLGEPGVIVPVAIAEEERRQGRYRVL